MAICSGSAFLFFKYSYTLFPYTTPYIAYSILLSGMYIFALKAGSKIRAGKVPLYSAPRKRAELSLEVGSRKTASCIHSFAEQILAYRAEDIGRRISRHILEVKGDFCGKVQEILARHRRAGDYVKIGS